MSEDPRKEQLKRIEQLTGEVDDELLAQLLDDAEIWCLAYTRRTHVPDRLFWNTIGNLAIIGYNRLGTQGESARSEGGESYTFETAPANIVAILNHYRFARAGGVCHETAKTE